MWRIHQRPVNPRRKGLVRRKMLLFDDVIMLTDDNTATSTSVKMNVTEMFWFRTCKVRNGSNKIIDGRLYGNLHPRWSSTYGEYTKLSIDEMCYVLSATMYAIDTHVGLSKPPAPPLLCRSWCYVCKQLDTLWSRLLIRRIGVPLLCTGNWILHHERSIRFVANMDWEY